MLAPDSRGGYFSSFVSKKCGATFVGFILFWLVFNFFFPDAFYRKEFVIKYENCGPFACSQYAHCLKVNDQFKCECAHGFKGDGLTCTRDSQQHHHEETLEEEQTEEEQTEAEEIAGENDLIEDIDGGTIASATTNENDSKSSSNKDKNHKKRSESKRKPIDTLPEEKTEEEDTSTVVCNIQSKNFPSQPDLTLQLWPLPQKVAHGSTTIFLNSDTFHLISRPKNTEILRIFEWFKTKLFFLDPASPTQSTDMKGKSILPCITISIENPNTELQLGVDESYSLIIPSDGSPSLICAKTYYGAVNALQTFSQLIFFDFTDGLYKIRNAPWAIEDFPRYPHRGLLIDTGRHWQPVSTLLQVIDSMSYAKLNVFHWHIVDDESFALETKILPKLWYGAFSETERYTQEHVKQVVEYARQRNIRVYPEFDTPGHAKAWCKGYPELCPSDTCLEPMSPYDTSFEILKKLFNEVTGGKPSAGLFPDHFFHLGGDEVKTECWDTVPEVTQFLQKKGLSTHQGLLYFHQKVTEIALEQGRQPLVWEEPYGTFGNQLNRNLTIQTWKSWQRDITADIARDGYRVINNGHRYLDWLDNKLEKFYLQDPAEGLAEHLHHLVLGGESSMWGEKVDNSDLFNTVWPRSAASAERFWSHKDVRDMNKARERLRWFRCNILMKRGIGSGLLDVNAREAPEAAGPCQSETAINTWRSSLGKA